MQIKTKIQGKTIILIINSHTPDMSNAVGTRKEYRRHIKQIMRQIKKQDITIRATDNNGQVIKNTENGNKTIAKWTTSKENNKGTGDKLAKHCDNNNLFVANTSFCQENANIENLIKRTNGTKTSNRQIDYIAFSSERRNWVTNAQTKGVANPNSTLQHKTIKIDIKYDLIRTKTTPIRQTHKL